MLFIDFSSAFNTVKPHKRVNKLTSLGLHTTLCSGMLDFLTNRPQSISVGTITASTLTLDTGTPQGSILSPVLFTSIHPSNTTVKLADESTVVWLITGHDETHCREEALGDVELGQQPGLEYEGYCCVRFYLLYFILFSINTISYTDLHVTVTCPHCSRTVPCCCFIWLLYDIVLSWLFFYSLCILCQDLGLLPSLCMFVSVFLRLTPPSHPADQTHLVH